VISYNFELSVLNETNIIVAIITGLSGLVISALLAIKEIYINFLIKPKFSIQFKDDSICISESWAASGSLRRYYKVIILNEGRGIAKNF
jgi:hypothetical protein